jgi:hypothetical protein
MRQTVVESKSAEARSKLAESGAESLRCNQKV